MTEKVAARAASFTFALIGAPQIGSSNEMKAKSPDDLTDEFYEVQTNTSKVEGTTISEIEYTVYLLPSVLTSVPVAITAGLRGNLSRAVFHSEQLCLKKENV